MTRTANKGCCERFAGSERLIDLGTQGGLVGAAKASSGRDHQLLAALKLDDRPTGDSASRRPGSAPVDDIQWIRQHVVYAIDSVSATLSSCRRTQADAIFATSTTTRLGGRCCGRSPVGSLRAPVR